jgi:hypothetical protein
MSERNQIVWIDGRPFPAIGFSVPVETKPWMAGLHPP